VRLESSGLEAKGSDDRSLMDYGAGIEKILRLLVVLMADVHVDCLRAGHLEILNGAREAQKLVVRHPGKNHVNA
jgi:hypothetical protein